MDEAVNNLLGFIVSVVMALIFRLVARYHEKAHLPIAAETLRFGSWAMLVVALIIGLYSLIGGPQ